MEDLQSAGAEGAHPHRRHDAVAARMSSVTSLQRVGRYLR